MTDLSAPLVRRSARKGAKAKDADAAALPRHIPVTRIALGLLALIAVGVTARVMLVDDPEGGRPSATVDIAGPSSSNSVAGEVGTPGEATIYAFLENAMTTVPVRVIPPAVATVTLDPATTSVEQNQWVALTAALRDQSGAVLTDRSIVWTSSNPAIAEVTYSGRVVGVAAGVATITATSEGRSGRSTVTVTAAEVASTDRLTESISFNW